MKTVKCDKCGRIAETRMDAVPWVELGIDIQCKGTPDIDNWHYDFDFDLCSSCKREYIDSLMSVIHSLLVK